MPVYADVGGSQGYRLNRLRNDQAGETVIIPRGCLTAEAEWLRCKPPARTAAGPPRGWSPAQGWTADQREAVDLLTASGCNSHWHRVVQPMATWWPRNLVTPQRRDVPSISPRMALISKQRTVLGRAPSPRPWAGHVLALLGIRSSFQPAIVRAQSRAWSLSGTPGNNRLNSMVAESSPHSS